VILTRAVVSSKRIEEPEHAQVVTSARLNRRRYEFFQLGSSYAIEA